MVQWELILRQHWLTQKTVVLKLELSENMIPEQQLPWTTLTSNGIPYINDAYGINDGSGLHHNKFFIIDYRGGAPDSVWVIMGSWNPTDPGTNDDRQNLVLIQDVALAGAYTVEFQEEWGSNTDTPNSHKF